MILYERLSAFARIRNDADLTLFLFISGQKSASSHCCVKWHKNPFKQQFLHESVILHVPALFLKLYDQGRFHCRNFGVVLWGHLVHVMAETTPEGPSSGAVTD